MRPSSPPSRTSTARGLAVTLTPFIFMDVPAGNALPDPYTGAAAQPAYPWRGRITVDPAPGQPGTPDQTAAAATQVAAFVGTADVSDFAIAERDRRLFRPRRVVLPPLRPALRAPRRSRRRRRCLRHRLARCAASPQVRDGASTYPFVAALVALAADVKAVLGPGTKVTYAADWSEYFGHQPADGSGDVYFHLDPLWSSAAIDAIGIDVYWPLADWRDGTDHLDRLAGARLDLRPRLSHGNIAGGEGYDWYYASPADRDGADPHAHHRRRAGKPWVFRFKDIRSWWLNQHFDRPGGVESGTPTAWVPQSKPFWFMELGCPAVDKGANQPNVFIDPKSSESLPALLLRTARATTSCSAATCRPSTKASIPRTPTTSPAPTPISAVYAGRMVDLARMHVYSWDARPYPAFPADTDVWGDGANWRLGHWLTGRLASAPLAATVAAILADYGFAAHDASALDGIARRLRRRPRDVGARGAAAAGARLLLRHARERAAASSSPIAAPGRLAAELTPDDLVETPPRRRARHPHPRPGDRPAGLRQAHLHRRRRRLPGRVEEARRLAGHSGRVALADLPLVLGRRAGRRRSPRCGCSRPGPRASAPQFALPPSRLALEPGDVVAFAADGRTRLLRITEIGEHGARDIEARGIDPDIYAGAAPAVRPPARRQRRRHRRPAVRRVPRPAAAARRRARRMPATSRPRRALARCRRLLPLAGGLRLPAQGDGASAPAVTGVTLDPLPAGAHLALRPRQQGPRRSSTRAALASVTELALLRRRQRSPPIQSMPTASGRCCSSNPPCSPPPRPTSSPLFLRGQAGTEAAMRAPLAAGARFVLLDAAPTPRRHEPGRDRPRLHLALRPRRPRHRPRLLCRNHTRVPGRGLAAAEPGARARRTRLGDLAISWVRRTRIGGDSWDAAEVPLGEDTERYEVDILDGATLKRTLSATSPTVTYTAAQQTADFGAPQSSVSCRVYQLSPVHGRGTPRPAVL